MPPVHFLPQIFFPLLLLLLPICKSASATENLSIDYYQKSCPRALDIIREAVVDKQIRNPTTAAGTVRLFFHDCFVGGCDASVLISSTAFRKGELDADINRALPGDAFDLVVRAKTALELSCPGVVSCADILAVAARDLITMVGGPFYHVLLGRKDSTAARVPDVKSNLPLPSMPMSEMISIFSRKNFTVREMVALAGAHTIGFCHCSEFAHLLYGYGKAQSFSPSYNPRYAMALQKACSSFRQDPSISIFNDIITPGVFDNMYFRNLPRGLGLLESDHALAGDYRTKPIIEEYAANQTAFFDDFAHAMEKLSVYGVKTADGGDVRRRCDAFN